MKKNKLMFDVADFVIIIILCCTFIFFLIFLNKQVKVKKIKENVKIEVGQEDIQQIYYTDEIYQVVSNTNKIGANGSELENTQVSAVSEEQMELGVVAVVDDGDGDGNGDDSGFFVYQPPNGGDDEDESGDENVPEPPRTWDDFMKERTQSKIKIKEVIAAVREELVEKPLSDEEFKRRYFSRLYGNNKENETE
ncbi:MAG: hypothetical protein LBG48_05950 [Rickettsiales bacterium]|nr:hypothetical protein [Rickettsiales bacterium]